MNYGTYLAASGVLTNMHRQDVTANNLANVSTVGFKRNLADLSQRAPEVREDNLDPALAHELLDRIGGGVLVARSRIDARPGSLMPTGNGTDLAIKGDGFFAVADAADKDNPVKLTRDGRFTLGRDGHLVTVIGGHSVLDEAGQPITLDPEKPITVDPQGHILQANQVVSRLKLVGVADPSELKAVGGGLLLAGPAMLKNARPATGQVLQGALEQSNVDPVREMLAMIESTRAINFNAQLIRVHDDVMDRAVNQFARVA